MSQYLYLRACSIIVFAAAVSYCAGENEVRVTADHVNLRAAASEQSEVVSQVARGDVITLAGAQEGSWAAVIPPQNVTLWVHSEMIKGDVVIVPKARVRAGPGSAYRTVGNIVRGDKVAVRDSSGEWLKIAPPSGTVLWISKKYVEPVSAASAVAAEKPSQEVSASQPIPQSTPSSSAVSEAGARSTQAPPMLVQNELPPSPAETKPASPPASRQEAAAEPISKSELVPEMEQGKQVKCQGIMNYASYVLHRPSRFILIMKDNNGRILSCSYVKGKDSQYVALVGREVTVEGKEYWMQGVRYSVIEPDRIAVVTKSSQSR